jgi:hypothetical protein
MSAVSWRVAAAEIPALPVLLAADEARGTDTEIATVIADSVITVALRCRGNHRDALYDTSVLLGLSLG